MGAMPPPRANHHALRLACEVAGGQNALAAALGTTQSLVWYWLERSKKGVPAEHVLTIERLTGISRYDLRPDIYPPLVTKAAE